MSDAHLEDGAPAAAAASGAVRGAGERHGPHPARQAHQRAAGRHGRPAGLRVHRGQLRGPADEDTQPDHHHSHPRHRPGFPLEELGSHIAVPGPLPAASEMTCVGRGSLA